MSSKSLPKSEMAAYFYAGIGVTAFELRIGIGQISMTAAKSEERRLLLAPLDRVRQMREDSVARPLAVIRDYVTVLMAGSVGQLLRNEVHHGFDSPCPGQLQLQENCLRAAKRCAWRSTDRAYAIALGYLRSSDEGNPEVTIERLWRRANRLLRQEPNRGRVDQLAQKLKAVKSMSGEEVYCLLSR